MRTFADIFHAFGGPRALAAEIGIPASHAHAMRARGSIPVEHWDALLAAARRKGIRLSDEQLRAIRKNRFATESAA